MLDWVADGCTFGGYNAVTGSLVASSPQGQWPTRQEFSVIDLKGIDLLMD
jgi:hypothetical protein